MGSFKTYYELLGVNPSSNADEIRSGFRKLAHKYHPDKNGNSSESEIVFRSLHEAYRILSSPELKSQYDTYLKNSSVLRDKISTYNNSNKSVVSILEGLCTQLNFVLWEIEDIFSMRTLRHVDFDRQLYSSKTLKGWLLTILYFLDKWVLTPAGQPDYFYTARQIDNKQAYSTISNGFSNSGHNPYMSFTDYFFQVRKRMDKMINSLTMGDLSQTLPGTSVTLQNAMYESLNLSYFYMGSLISIINGQLDSMEKFHHSHIVFDERISGSIG